MDKKTKKKGSALPITAIILSCVAILLSIVIILGAILMPIIKFAKAIIKTILTLAIPTAIVLIAYLVAPDALKYSTVPIYGGCQITQYIGGVFSSGELVIPETINDETVVSIGESAFEGNTGLVSVTLPSGVKNIEANAFAYCESLEKIVFPDGLEYIGDNAFIGCTSLKSIEIGASTRFIGNNAFQDCTSLESVEISNGVEEIGMQAFYNCTSLKAIEIPQNVFKIGMGAFFGCDSMTTAIIYGSYNVGDGTVSVGDYPNLQQMANALTGIYSQYDWVKE